MSVSGSGEKPGELVAAAIDSDSELNAIRVVLSALVPLKREGRSRVLDYVLKRLGVLGESLSQVPSTAVPASTALATELPSQHTDIRSLTKEKSPSSANEMAALVAYYVAEVAPEPYRKQTINADDIKTYFKQALFKLPSSAKMTLVNAKNAGYLEPSGEVGQYRLNPVGYNLVVHNLPAGKARKKTGSRKAKSRKASRKRK